MKARLEARMVVASTSCGWAAAFPVAADRPPAASQNGWRAADMNFSSCPRQPSCTREGGRGPDTSLDHCHNSSLDTPTSEPHIEQDAAGFTIPDRRST